MDNNTTTTTIMRMGMRMGIGTRIRNNRESKQERTSHTYGVDQPKRQKFESLGLDPAALHRGMMFAV